MKTIITIIFFVLITKTLKSQPPETGNVTDINGNIYKTVIIGHQEWMAENLRTTNFNNGTDIPIVSELSVWGNLTSGAYCWYNNDSANARKYGALYNWYAVNTNNLCPVGWQVPSDEDWKQLEGYVDSVYNANNSIWNGTMLRGYDAGKRLKGKFEWNSNGEGLDSYGFSTLPSGECSGNKYHFRHLGNNGFWWCRTEFDSSNAWYRSLVFFDDRIIRNTHPKTMGFSVRCIKNK